MSDPRVRGPFAVFACAVLVVGCASVPEGAPPATDGPLPPCPPRPNCVSSVEGDVDGFPVEGSIAATRARLEKAIRETGGVLVESRPERLRATWRSRVFRFVDDVELALAADGTRFEVRSASRVGYSDFGANRRRVARLRAHFLGDASRRPQVTSPPPPDPALP